LAGSSRLAATLRARNGSGNSGEAAMLFTETAAIAFVALLFGLVGIWRLVRKLRP
jgi:hypothetical protein